MKAFALMTLGALLVLWSTVALSGTETDKKATATYGHYYFYSDGTVLIREAEGIQIESDGGSGMYDVEIAAVKFCSTKSDMICMVGGVTEPFAVPRRPLAIDDKWTFDGSLFTVLPCITTMDPGNVPTDSNPMIKMRVLGQEVSFYVIAKMGADGKYPIRLFYFSPERGLIGEADPAEQGPINAPLLQEAYGPGSKEFDTKIPSTVALSDDELKKLLAEPLVTRELPKKHQWP